MLVIQSAGNILPTGAATLPWGAKTTWSPAVPILIILSNPRPAVANPGQSLQALTVGSVAYDAFAQGPLAQLCSGAGLAVGLLSRSGPGIWDVTKPEVVEYGGDFIRTENQPPDVQGRSAGIPDACPELVRSTLATPGPAVDRDADWHLVRHTQKWPASRPSYNVCCRMPPHCSYRALIVQSAQWPEWAEGVLTQIRTPPQGQTKPQRQLLLSQATQIMRSIGFGIPDLTRATANTDHRTTYITQAETAIHAYECHIYQVPIPEELRRPGDDFDIRIDVTLSYVAQPRRTRRNLRRYLSTWV